MPTPSLRTAEPASGSKTNSNFVSPFSPGAKDKELAPTQNGDAEKVIEPVSNSSSTNHNGVDTTRNRSSCQAIESSLPIESNARDQDVDMADEDVDAPTPAFVKSASKIEEEVPLLTARERDEDPTPIIPQAGTTTATIDKLPDFNLPPLPANRSPSTSLSDRGEQVAATSSSAPVTVSSAEQLTAALTGAPPILVSPVILTEPEESPEPGSEEKELPLGGPVLVRVDELPGSQPVVAAGSQPEPKVADDAVEKSDVSEKTIEQEVVAEPKSDVVKENTDVSTAVTNESSKPPLTLPIEQVTHEKPVTSSSPASKPMQQTPTSNAPTPSSKQQTPASKVMDASPSSGERGKLDPRSFYPSDVKIDDDCYKALKNIMNYKDEKRQNMIQKASSQMKIQQQNGYISFEGLTDKPEDVGKIRIATDAQAFMINKIICLNEKCRGLAFLPYDDKEENLELVMKNPPVDAAASSSKTAVTSKPGAAVSRQRSASFLKPKAVGKEGLKQRMAAKVSGVKRPLEPAAGSSSTLATQGADTDGSSTKKIKGGIEPPFEFKGPDVTRAPTYRKLSDTQQRLSGRQLTKCLSLLTILKEMPCGGKKFDVSQVAQKLSGMKYQDFTQFANDMRVLFVDNCKEPGRVKDVIKISAKFEGQIDLLEKDFTRFATNTQMRVDPKTLQKVQIVF